MRNFVRLFKSARRKNKKGFTPLETGDRRHPTAVRGSRSLTGFTLLEVMITTAVLALGASMIYQSFFITLDSYSYYSTLLKVTPWMDEKIWQAQNQIAHPGSGAQFSGGGRVQINDKEVNWGLDFNPLDNDQKLSAISLRASWMQGARQVKITRSAYALNVKK